MSDSETDYYWSEEEGEEEKAEEEEAGAVGPDAVQPYRFEPPARNPPPDDMEVDQPEEGVRAGNNNWCSCTRCLIMQEESESTCCQEAERVLEQVTIYNQETDSQILCITHHPGFQTVCLDRYVLDTAYLQFKQEHGNVQYREDE